MFCFYCRENWLFDSRDGVVEGDHGAADNRDVHDVPVIPQVRPGVQHKTTIQDLKNVLGMYVMWSEVMSSTLRQTSQAKVIVKT